MVTKAELLIYMSVAYLFGAFTVALMQWLNEEWILVDEFFYSAKEAIRKWIAKK